MLKQILSKIPRKSLKSDSQDLLRNNNKDNDDSPANTGNGMQFTNSCSVIGSRHLNVVKRVSSAIFPTGGGERETISPHLSFKDVSNGEKLRLFISKLNFCCSMYDSTDPNKKDLKSQMLIDLNDYVTSGSAKCTTEPAIAAVCRMCAFNLFRDFPPKYGRGDFVDEEEQFFYPAWHHLQLVYDLFLHYLSLSSLDPKVAKKSIDHSFITKLLNLFESDDPREREFLKSVLHRLYGKFMTHRPFIRKAMSHSFYRFVFETQRHNGIAELLEVFGSVITGFALPLKEEHKSIFSRALIPLHKPKSLGVYHQQLTYCIVQFVKKEQSLASEVITRLLRYWPLTNSQKEVMFIGEIEEVLEMISFSEFEKIATPLFRRIGSCLNSFHFQVAERAHLLWGNESVLKLIMHAKHATVPIVLSALERNSQNHWSKAIRNQSLNIIKVFHEMEKEAKIDMGTP
ncbi:unnamed protein product [Cuscuta campestris]|uniref:Serine/threonine protein phosphatase 2A regulatory subunit n=1 Tax=Cuscuta campestris TaxID=132261 RepID=A0A484KZA8_9ASTE|nr:unnamed protein product [Cuscuta campestris]